jgi:hypothetical protein
MAVTQQSRRGWHVTPARRQYNIQRTNQQRFEKGKETQGQVREGLDAKLGIGLKELEDALNQIEYKDRLRAHSYFYNYNILHNIP